MQALEALLTPKKRLDEGAFSLPDGHERRVDPSDRPFQEARECSTISPIKPSNSISGPLPVVTPCDSSRTVTFITSHLGGIDERSKMRIRSGEITIQDVLQAGLNALNLNTSKLSTRTNAQEKNEGCSALRTNKILIPQNRMLVYSHSLPCVYTNHLRIKQFSTVAAIRVNAELLGITFEELTNPATESPFYSNAVMKRSSNLAFPPKLLELKPHLQPIDPQIQYSHHAWVDLIPCPIFRQRFIQLTTTNPPMINQHEFCLDVENNGLVCWGSYIGEADEVSGAGAPWDIRSWEAQPWFLKKWWFVLGGQEGGIFQQTKWWHELRGDHLPFLP